MSRIQLKIRVDEQGDVEIVDPGFDTLDLLQSFDPGYHIRQHPLPGFSHPKFLTSRTTGCGYTSAELIAADTDEIWERHQQVLETIPQYPHDGIEASLLDLKIELARRVLSDCVLCARRCKVNRYYGEKGICQLGVDPLVAEHFVHIAEEAPINPSLVINLAGCGLRCRFCQQWKLLSPKNIDPIPLNAQLWDQLDLERARSLSFVGGNPDESLYGILKFLKNAPDSWSLPIVWNTHAYCSEEALTLLTGIVDVYLPDYKYGTAKCGSQLSGIPDYPLVAQKSIQQMLNQEVPVIARILVLPGHISCCHEKTLKALADMNNEYLIVSIRGQYCPDWHIKNANDALARRPNRGEYQTVLDKAQQLGLSILTDDRF